ncbi:PspC domain-containing protein [Actinophytocola sediminis]
MAAGIANRYRIDPTLVRIGLVVAAVYGGAGLVLYLLGWLFLPEQDDEVSPFESLIGRGRSSTSAMFTVLLCLAFIPTFSWFFNGFAPGYLSLLIAGGALYLLHNNRGQLNREQAAAPAQPDLPTPPMPPVPPMPPTPPAAPWSATVTQPTTTPLATPASAPTGATMPLPAESEPPAAEPAPEPEVRTTPPAWDPLGAAPFAWDLPDPNPELDQQEPEPPPERHRKSRIGLVTVGLALIAVAGMSIADNSWLNAQHIVGVAMAILGLGMVAGSFVRGGRGLIGLAVPLSVIGIGLTTISPQGWNGVGEVKASPTTINQVQPEYRRSVGSVDLDLTGLPATGEVDTEIDLGLGDVSVVLPENADVWLNCHTALGSTECLGERRDDINAERLPEIVDFGEDGKGGLRIHLNVDVGTGSLEVSRG